MQYIFALSQIRFLYSALSASKKMLDIEICCDFRDQVNIFFLVWLVQTIKHCLYRIRFGGWYRIVGIKQLGSRKHLFLQFSNFSVYIYPSDLLNEWLDVKSFFSRAMLKEKVRWMADWRKYNLSYYFYKKIIWFIL